MALILRWPCKTLFASLRGLLRGIVTGAGMLAVNALIVIVIGSVMANRADSNSALTCPAESASAQDRETAYVARPLLSRAARRSRPSAI